MCYKTLLNPLNFRERIMGVLSTNWKFHSITKILDKFRGKQLAHYMFMQVANFLLIGLLSIHSLMNMLFYFFSVFVSQTSITSTSNHVLIEYHPTAWLLAYIFTASIPGTSYWHINTGHLIWCVLHEKDLILIKIC